MNEESDVDERTVWCGNLSEKMTEELLYELFLQAGPIERVRIPYDNGRQCSYGFVTFQQACSCDYAIGIFVQTSLFGRQLKIQRRTRNNYSNGQQEAVFALQYPNSLTHPNLPFMLPQHMTPNYPNSPNHFPGKDMYYMTPQRSYNHKKSPTRRSPQRYHSSGRYDRHKNRDDFRSGHKDNHSHGHHRKRHKR